ncbi:hypothetical protein [Rhodococcus sp. (in: high G+C Gram-positive bacteria)]|uniref:hypothetical protein n=2 Tax=Rhodococcus TaxID=1827 RepID=UPI00257A9801|nr:hypothetical protein [Rhodococcus sp. (in: high G+C Gram-positive bacteria)]
MPDTLEADLPQIRTVSDRFDAHATEVSAIDTTGIRVDDAHTYLKKSDIAVALGSAEEATRRALLLLADRAWALHDTLDRACEDYTRADEYLRDELNKAVRP